MCRRGGGQADLSVGQGVRGIGRSGMHVAAARFPKRAELSRMTAQARGCGPAVGRYNATNSSLLRHGFHADNFAGLTFRHDFERAAADLAVCVESLTAQAGVYDHFTGLAAVRTLDFGEFFHAANLAVSGQSANPSAAQISNLRHDRGLHRFRKLPGDI